MRAGQGVVTTLGRSYEHGPHPTEAGHRMNSTVEELDGNKVKVSVSSSIGALSVNGGLSTPG